MLKKSPTLILRSILGILERFGGKGASDFRQDFWVDFSSSLTRPAPPLRDGRRIQSAPRIPPDPYHYQQIASMHDVAYALHVQNAEQCRMQNIIILTLLHCRMQDE